ncbi:arabinogalactan endo-1 [Sporomusaceae bacterium BoRhaA]|uniref:glycosyl hydrolase 53 family protein n=1 Tax=Pelorhabdus rhamnosifermentans TaxID=2772457 RepID=UPI001C060128|nr:glycosyl hydrolase 53 family protein [Pelorhabdus rhamnosifermentans]MBU2703237.1 arabinogalactan endo-1 [Pelorhabdus rhamnosifermentans]
MKKNKLVSLMLSTLMIGTIMFSAPNAEAAIHVNPIDGIRPDFIKGADISMLKEIELKGGKFYDQGIEKDCLDILQQHGINWVRLRIWNNPIVNGVEVGGGNSDEAKALEMAARAKAKGMKVLIDFHYSDFWADPGKQNKPAAWANDNAQQLADDIYQYTSKVMKDFAAEGIEPDMVQIGNEINNGMLWPEGKPVSSEGYKNLANMIRQGLKAVRDNDPDRSIKLMIHLANGGDNGLYRSFFDSLILENKVNDFDVIGLSYYPFWHGKMEQLESNMNDVSTRYNKDVVVVETALGFTNDNGDFQKNCYGPNEERLGGYKSSVQGQATGIRNIMEAVSKVNNKRGIGVFYWEPDWIPTPGAGWKHGEGDEWDNLAMFDFQGNALESLDIFKLVSDPNNHFVQATVKELEPADVTGNIGVPTELPKVIGAVYTDDSVKELPVSWENAKLVYDAVGNYRVSGTVLGTDQAAITKINVINKVNLVKNGDFETGDLSQWTIKGDVSAVNNSSSAGDVRGKSAMHYWADKPFAFIATQTITGLKNGKYTLSCWTQGGGGEKAIQLFASDYGGDKMTTAIINDGWNKWHQWVIKDIHVTNGKLTIGLDNQANAGNWGSFDDVELYAEE